MSHHAADFLRSTSLRFTQVSNPFNHTLVYLHCKTLAQKPRASKLIYHFLKIRLRLHLYLVLLIGISPIFCCKCANTSPKVALILVLTLPRPNTDFRRHHLDHHFRITRNLSLPRTRAPSRAHLLTHLLTYQLFRQNLEWSSKQSSTDALM